MTEPNSGHAVFPDLSTAELRQLYKIATGALHGLRHDLRNPLVTIRLALDTMQRRLDHASDGISADELQASVNLLESGYRRAERLIETAFVAPTGESVDEPFVASPAAVVQDLSRAYADLNVTVAEGSDHELLVLFPSITLHLVLNELFANASRHTAPPKDLRVEWQVQGRHFRCSIHSRGDASVELPDTGYMPLDGIPQLRGSGTGLRFVWRIVHSAGGMLLFRRSSLLGGLEALLDVPVFGYRSHGGLFRFSDVYQS